MAANRSGMTTTVEQPSLQAVVRYLNLLLKSFRRVRMDRRRFRMVLAARLGAGLGGVVGRPGQAAAARVTLCLTCRRQSLIPRR